MRRKLRVLELETRVTGMKKEKNLLNKKKKKKKDMLFKTNLKV